MPTNTCLAAYRVVCCVPYCSCTPCPHPPLHQEDPGARFADHHERDHPACAPPRATAPCRSTPSPPIPVPPPSRPPPVPLPFTSLIPPLYLHCITCAPISMPPPLLILPSPLPHPSSLSSPSCTLPILCTMCALSPMQLTLRGRVPGMGSGEGRCDANSASRSCTADTCANVRHGWCCTRHDATGRRVAAHELSWPSVLAGPTKRLHCRTRLDLPYCRTVVRTAAVRLPDRVAAAMSSAAARCGFHSRHDICPEQHKEQPL